MQAPVLPRRVYRFGLFQLDMESGTLLRQGQPVKLQDQPRRMLCHLVQRPGKLVTREELRERLWPEGTYVEFDGSLKAALKRLRSALKDDADNPVYIETVPKQGYRFIAPVVCEPASEVDFATYQKPGVESPSPDDSGHHPVLNLEHVSADAGKSDASWMVTKRISRLKPSAAVLLVLLLAAAVLLLGRIGNPGVHVRSIAVLPFQNLSNDPERDYLSDGMTDELITDLAELGSVRVISYTSVMQFKNARKPLADIARALNVDALVEGSVESSPGRIHVIAQLVKANPETHLWAASYDRSVTDATALQEELAREIVGAIRLKIASQTQMKTARKSVSPEAHESYLKGRYFWSRRTDDGFRRAIRYFNQAIAEQPNYAAAYAGLADSYLLLGGYFAVPQSESIPQARAAAQRALQLDNSLADAHATLGLIAMNYDWNWPEAERQFRVAIEMNPNYAIAHHWYAEYLTLVGRPDESLAEIQTAQDLDPLSVIISVDRGKYLYMQRKYSNASAQLQEALAMDPNYMWAHLWLARVRIAEGKPAEAVADLEKIRNADDSRVSLAILVAAYSAAGKRRKALNALSELKRLARHQHVDSNLFIEAYAGLHDDEQTLSWLQRAYAEHSVALPAMKVSPIFDFLRSDPRFQDLLRRINIPQ